MEQYKILIKISIKFVSNNRAPIQFLSSKILNELSPLHVNAICL